MKTLRIANNNFGDDGV